MVCLGTAGSNNCSSPLILSLLLGCFSFFIFNIKSKGPSVYYLKM